MLDVPRARGVDWLEPGEHIYPEDLEAAEREQRVTFPIHVLALNATGVHLFDYLRFEEVVPVCEASGRWESLIVAAPLRIVGGTGSPLNPLAIF